MSDSSSEKSWYKSFNDSRPSSDKLVKGDFDHQVAGHTSEKLQTCYSKYVMKPRIKYDLFKKEIQYYEAMNSSDVVPHFRNPFVPKYYGIFHEKIENNFNSFEEVEQAYLVLEDLTLGYEMPNLIDIKMGQQTYEPTAGKDKINREIIKYPFQVQVGFRITGFKVFHANSDEYIYVDKHFGRGLIPECVDYGLALFFYNGVVFCQDILELTIEKLKGVLKFMKVQTMFHCFCSSILIVYDSFNQERSGEGKESESSEITATTDTSTICDVLEENYNNSTALDSNTTSIATQSFADEEKLPHVVSPGESSESLLKVNGMLSDINHSRLSPSEDGQKETKTYLSESVKITQRPRSESDLDRVRVAMIDFAHTIQPTGDKVGTIDEGYVYGVTSLIERLQAILDILNSCDDNIIGEFIRNMELVYQKSRK